MSLRHIIGKRYNAFNWLSSEFRFLVKHLGSSDKEKTKEKFEASLIIESHIIEKGLSFRNVKIGFGEIKIITLLDNLLNYYKSYHDKKFVIYILSPIKEYIDFQKGKGHENADIIKKYELMHSLIQPTEFKINGGGAFNTSRAEIHRNALIDFESFVNNRFSIRDFSDKPVDIELVKKAIKIATRTPSACNRQPWKVHLFVSKNKIIEILDYQTGARQFKDQIGCAILVTSSYNYFFGGEFHQPYVNGSLYAMTLIYALHSLGLGTIPLNMGFTYKKLKKLKEIIDIEDNEVPVLLIGIGNIPDQLNVAYSQRFDYKNIIREY